MSGKGYIRLHRQIQDCWIWEDKFSKGQAWVDLLLYANHRDKKVPFKKEIVTVKRGQFLTSIRKLADRWGWHRNTVSNFLKLLEKDNMVCVDVSTSYTLITIVNYDVYQYSEDEDVPQSVPEDIPESVPPTVPPSVPPSSTTNKCINDNNDNKDIYNPPFNPPTGEKEKPKKLTAKELAKTFKTMIDETDLSDALKNKLHEWIDYKVEIKHPYKTEKGMNQFISQVTKYTLGYSDVEIIEVINRTMASEYQGIVWDWLEKNGNKSNSKSNKSNDTSKLKALEDYYINGGV